MKTFIPTPASVAIVCILIPIIIWAYHRYKYSNSSFQKFEYYLLGEGFIEWLCLIVDFLLKIAAIITVIWVLALFITKVF